MISSHVPRGSQNPTRGAISSRQQPYRREENATPFRTQGARTLNYFGNNNDSRRAPYRQLTEAEAAEKKAKGLCLRCDGRYYKGHSCQLPELRVFVMREEGTGYEIEEEGEEVKEQEEEVPEVAQLLLNSMVGLSSPRTIKLIGKINQEVVLVLIDSGASHNFIASRLVSKLELLRDETA